MADVRTLGIEEELHVVDLHTGRLTAGAPRVLRGLPTDGFSVELQRSTVETNTSVWRSLSDLRSDVVRLRGLVEEVAAAADLGVIASGTAPVSRSDDFELTTLGRYSRMQQDYRFLVEDQLICGLQVHVGVADRDLAVRVAQRVSADLPTLLAMSASSPYWHSADTGYASFRTMVWQRWPSTGSFGYAESAADYDRLIDDLIASGVISDPKMAYFDVRPSAHVPTVEMRVCDTTPLVDDAILIAGLFRALVEEAIARDVAGDSLLGRPAPIHRAAMWRAARSGLTGPLLGGGAAPEPVSGAEAVGRLLTRLRGHLEDSGDWDDVSELAEGMLARGDSSSRQRYRFTERGRMADVVGLLMAETRSQVSAPVTPLEVTGNYPDAPDDEALSAAGVPYLVYRPVFELFDELGADELRHRAEVAGKAAADANITFGIGGEQRPFPVDLVPRIVPAHEWSVLSAGLVQRARAIELFLRDVYGPARIVEDHILDWATVHDGPEWQPAMRGIPSGTVRAPIIGFDLVRDALGGWRVLEDNTRTPSGIAYAIGVRQLMRRALPELAADVAIREPRTALGLLGRTLRDCSERDEPVVALLSDGADNSAWFEHQTIAEGAGLLLVQPDEIGFARGRVLAGDRRVDVLYLRLGVDLAALRNSHGARIGELIVAAALDGSVVLANAPGSGVADDKAMYCLVPEFINYYLGERPLLSPVPTYRCADPGEREAVLSRLGDLVTKPVDGFGGGGVLIGPHASKVEIEERRAEIVAHPKHWIAQELVALSTHPTLAHDTFEPRHVDLRAFVCLSGTEPGEASLADLALTRMAPAGSMVVNSSRGGGAKDTWIITDPDESG